jgi:enolase
VSSLSAHELLDSRGVPTVEVTIAGSGATGVASDPGSSWRSSS